jgi:hypothetical protein
VVVENANNFQATTTPRLTWILSAAEVTLMPRLDEDPYEAVPHHGNIFAGDDDGQYYWNFADAGTVIERDFSRLREAFGEALVRMEEIEYGGKRYVIQLWRFYGYDENGVRRTSGGTDGGGLKFGTMLAEVPNDSNS